MILLPKDVQYDKAFCGTNFCKCPYMIKSWPPHVFNCECFGVTLDDIIVSPPYKKISN